jgi:hypothetical protein
MTDRELLQEAVKLIAKFISGIGRSHPVSDEYCICDQCSNDRQARATLKRINKHLEG